MKIKRYEMTVRQDDEGRFFYTDAQAHFDGYWIRYEDMIDYIAYLDAQRSNNCVDEVLKICQQAEQQTGIDWINNYERNVYEQQQQANHDGPAP